MLNTEGHAIAMNMVYSLVYQILQPVLEKTQKLIELEKLGTKFLGERRRLPPIRGDRDL